MPIPATMKPRRAATFLVTLSVLLTACASQTPFPFPETVATWHRQGTPTEATQEAQPGTRNLGLESVTAATYSGDGNPRVIAHRMPTSASAFEAVQHWRPESGTLAFQYGIFFVVVRSPALANSTLSQFATELKASLPAQ